MPGLIMERPKMSQQMHENLKRYILKERRRKKEEDVANEQKLREEMRKAEMTTQSIENIKEQIRDTETKLEELNHRKRDLFAQLKKVLNEETNLKKKPIETQQPSQAMQQQQQTGGGAPPPFLFQPGIHQPAGVYPTPGGPPPQSLLFTQQLKFLSPSPQAPTSQRLQMFKPEPLIQVPQQQQQQQVKRQRSPSPLPQLLPTSTLSPVSNQTTAFSPNTKKTRPNTVTSSNINQPQQTTPPSIQIPTAFQPNIIQPQTPTRLTGSSYGQQTPGQQSAFSTYQGSYLGAAMQQPQQKATLLGVQPAPTTPPTSSGVHAIPAYALTNTPPRPIPTSQIDLQKLLYPQANLGLLNAHPQSGGILSGYPLQRGQPGTPSQHQQQQQYQ